MKIAACCFVVICISAFAWRVSVLWKQSAPRAVSPAAVQGEVKLSAAQEWLKQRDQEAERSKHQVRTDSDY